MISHVHQDLLDRQLTFYKKVLAKYLQEFEAHLNSPNLKEISNIGHKLRGNAALFGFPKLGYLGKELESAAASGNEQAASEIMDEIKKFILDHGLT